MTKLATLVVVLTIVQFALQSNTVEYLSDDGYSSSMIMLISSLVMLVISVSICLQKGLSPLSIRWKAHRLRLICSGLGLYLSTLSYHYLHATTATVILQLNIPFIIILSAFSTRRVDRKLILSLGVVSVTSLFFGFSSYSAEPGLGVLIALTAVVILAMSYLLVKKSVSVENRYVVINMTCLSCIGVSLLSLLFTSQSGWHYDPVDLSLLVGVGLLRFGQNVCLLILLQTYSTDRAQLPFLLGALATMFLEMGLEHRIFPVPYLIANFVLTLLVSLLVLIPVTEVMAESTSMRKPVTEGASSD